MMNIYLKRIIFSIIVFASVFCFSCCQSIWENLTEKIEIETDVYGNVYTVKNKNYLKFDTYNTLEVIVSKNERFILYDTAVDDQKESGFGEWIRGSIAIPVAFRNDTDGNANLIHGDILIEYNQNAFGYLALDQVPDIPSIFIARIKNDTENPGLQWWVSGQFNYNDKYGEIVSVEYHTYTKGETDKWTYIPEQAYSFYAVEENQTVTYSCKDGNFEFDALTGDGTWTVNETPVPIRAWFNIEDFSVLVCYNTNDNKNGQYIFIGYGLSIDENTAVFSTESSPDFYGDSLSTVIIHKIIH